MAAENLTKNGHTLTQIALKAGTEIMGIYADPIETETKEDKSPVTKADKASEIIILAELAKAYPDIPIVSEEAASEGNIPDIGDRFFLVDPLDGTREFIKKNGEFTVNIALIEKGLPVAGIVYAPALLKAYYGELGHGAWRLDLDTISQIAPFKYIKISANPVPKENLTLVGSRSHSDQKQAEFVKKHNVSNDILMGSSLKFCVIAEGDADIYPRFGRTMEWDTAAGQAVLVAAGGSVMVMDEDLPLTYGKKHRGLDNPSFIAFGAD